MKCLPFLMLFLVQASYSWSQNPGQVLCDEAPGNAALSVEPAKVSEEQSHEYKGKTDQDYKLSFRATRAVVTGFSTSVSALCVSAASARSKIDIYPVLLESAGTLEANGQFKLSFKGKSSTFIDVSGQVQGRTASGRLEVRYNKTLGATSTGLLAIGACSAKTTWMAQRD